jgi:hypothetical protein
MSVSAGKRNETAKGRNGETKSIEQKVAKIAKTVFGSGLSRMIVELQECLPRGISPGSRSLPGPVSGDSRGFKIA